MNFALNILSAGFALAAALLWCWSATIKISYSDKLDEKGIYSAAISVDNNKTDFVKTVIAQSIWSKRAAYASAAAAFLQAVSLLIQAFCSSSNQTTT